MQTLESHEEDRAAVDRGNIINPGVEGRSKRARTNNYKPNGIRTEKPSAEQQKDIDQILDDYQEDKEMYPSLFGGSEGFEAWQYCISVHDFHQKLPTLQDLFNRYRFNPHKERIEVFMERTEKLFDNEEDARNYSPDHSEDSSIISSSEETDEEEEFEEYFERRRESRRPVVDSESRRPVVDSESCPSSCSDE